MLVEKTKPFYNAYQWTGDNIEDFKRIEVKVLEVDNFGRLQLMTPMRNVLTIPKNHWLLISMHYLNYDIVSDYFFKSMYKETTL